MNELVSQPTCTDPEEDSVDEDENSKVENVVTKPQRAPLKSHLIEKFNFLKEKRLKLARRYEKRREKRPNTTQNMIESNLQQIQSVTNVDEPNLPPVKCLKKQLDQELAEANIEKAERISDDIYAKNTQLEVLKRKEIVEFEKELETKKKKKKRLINWRFEAKQRWESKSNM